ncbi:SusC/RagA family TonB-linked outer membrane protein [Filimonas effusa]|nr:SusC/RagA family TonB-linked outer membrane protein [Filimonas effusa]
MRLTILLVTVAFLNVSAKGISQKVSFAGKNTSLKTVFSEIEKQTGYVFLYPENTLKIARPVTIQATDKPLLEFLEELFAHQPLRYSIESKTISITTAPAVPVKKNIVPELQAYLPPPPVSGIVKDSAGKPLAGVTVSVVAPGRGTYAATTTDNKGHFEIVANKGEKLTFALIGYAPHTVSVGERTSFEVVMTATVSELSELLIQSVNTGYQRIRPEQSTGAVAQLSTKEYESRISTNFIDGLVNRMPGLMINNNISFTSTTPGSTSSNSRSLFNIRGISTMSANQSPLIVVDGYPTELTLDMLDPNEIKSVTILKDAAAATVYGVRASNGVIVIERKQAALGKPRFSFRATAGMTPEENYSRYRWASDASAIAVNFQKDIYASGINASTWGLLNTNSQGTTSRNPVYYIMAQEAAKVITPYQAQQAYASLLSYDNLNDYSRLFKRSALTQTYNFNVSGGTGNALYYITANYTRNRLSDIKNDNNKFLLSARSTLKLSQRLSLELTTDYQEHRVNNVPVPSPTSTLSYERFEDANGNPSFVSGSGLTPFYNDALVAMGLQNQLYYPLQEINEVSDKTRTINNRITANFNYNIGSGFDLSFGGIYETSRSDFRHLASAASFQTRNAINLYTTQNTDGTIKLNVPKGDLLQREASNTSSYTGRAQLNYNKRIGSLHSVNAILGAEIRNVINSSNLTSQFGYNDQTLLLQPVDYASIFTGVIKNPFGISTNALFSDYSNLFNEQYTEDRFLSGYANVVYSFKNTYSLTGSMRIDQSNLFGTNPKYKYKPLWSLGAAWNIHKESFMQDIDWINTLKLRVAYGFNGNVAKMSLPQVIAQSTLNYNTSPTSQALRLLSYANSSLRWEQTRSTNIGLDYRFSNNIYGTVDYYKKKSTDLLGNAQIDPTIGASPSLINQATIDNSGLELSLHADWITTSKFNWNTGFVLGRNTSKVLSVYRTGDYNPRTLNVLGYVKGYPVGAQFAFGYAGLDTAGYPLMVNDRGQYYRTNIASSTSPTAIASKSDTSGLTRYAGTSIPTINAGLSNRIDIGNFYIFCMINYYGGFKVRVPRPTPNTQRPLEGAGNYWKKRGDEATTDVMNLAGFYGNTMALDAYNYADAYVVNGDYITLGDLTVSYSLDNSKFIKKIGFSHFEIKCQASNLWTVGFNKYNYSMATGSYAKSYLTPTYTLAIFTNF